MSKHHHHNHRNNLAATAASPVLAATPAHIEDKPASSGSSNLDVATQDGQSIKAIEPEPTAPVQAVVPVLAREVPMAKPVRRDILNAFGFRSRYETSPT